jgi:gamma-glutamyltranspeptidase / glutathione hydrolase
MVTVNLPNSGAHYQWIPQFFLRYVHAGLNLQEAIDTPAWHTEHSLAAHGTTRCFGHRRNRVPSVTVDELRRRGHYVEIGPDWSEGRLVAAAPYRLLC